MVWKSLKLFAVDSNTAIVSGRPGRDSIRPTLNLGSSQCATSEAWISDGV
jgi:hypothetical protein